MNSIIPITPDATATLKGKILLTGNLGGTADSPTVTGLAAAAYPLQAGSGVRTLGVTPANIMYLGGDNMASDATAARVILQGRNAYEQSSTDKPGADLVLAGGIGRRFVTIVNATLIDAGADNVQITVNRTTTTITAGTGWTVFTNNAACAADLSSYINSLAIGVTASTDGVSKVFIAPNAGTYSLLVSTNMTASEGTTTSGTDGSVVLPDGGFGTSGVTPAIVLEGSSTTGWYRRASATWTFAVAGNGVLEIGSANLTLQTSVSVSWTSGTVAASTDLQISRFGVANLKVGKSNNSSPAAQIITIGESSRPGTDSNVGGGSATLESGLGTGTGTASSVIVKTPTLAASGTGVQSQAERARFNATGLTLAAGSKLLLGNAAVTGLVAGSLAALTNASIVIEDSTGTSYRIPCTTP